jgi:hypothetical protein
MRVCAPLLPAAALAVAPTATAPVRPGREEARSWALDELSRREYADSRPGVLERLVEWLLRHLQGIGSVDSASSLVVLGILTAGLVTVVTWGVWRAGGLGRTARRHELAVLGDPTATAADHRAAADRAAAAGDWSAAVLHRFRAIARALEEDAVLSPQPGRTADEVAREAGRRLSPLSGDLLAGARTFDDVHYGHRRVDRAADERMRALDDAVRRARPTAAAATPDDRLAVPS